MSELTQKTLRAITERHIEPVPRWRTTVMRSLIWFGMTFLVLLSALLTALTLHAVFEIDWDAYTKADFTLVQIILSGVPLFSIFLLAVFLWGSTLLVRQIGRVYRYRLSTLVLIFLAANATFGFLVEASPLDQPAERFLLALIPHGEELQASLIPSAKRQWSQPERGLLSGAVLSSSATEIELRDSDARQWTIEYTPEQLDSDVRLEVDDEIKVIGTQQGKNAFRAEEVRSWESGAKTQKSESVKTKREEESSSHDIEDKQHQEREDKEVQDDDSDDEHENEPEED
jgi:hypothetical protein